MSKERDTTLIGTKDAAKILKRKAAMTRRLLSADPPIFKTARQISGRYWVAEKWELEQWAELHPKQTHKEN